MLGLAENLKMIQKELNCAQSTIAEVLKVGFRTYLRYEAGERDALISILIKITRLGKSILGKAFNDPDHKKQYHSPV